MEKLNILEQRMYFYVPYNISPIQQAIQAGHAALEYAYLYGRTKEFINFICHFKTWVILNGGTTNDQKDEDGFYLGSLNQIAQELFDNKIAATEFCEPDLNNALTAVCFLADERVFNKEDYPDFVNWLMDVKMYKDAADEAQKNNPAFWVELRMRTAEDHQRLFPEYYKEWIEFLGGQKNVFLRDLTQVRYKNKA